MAVARRRVGGSLFVQNLVAGVGSVRHRKQGVHRGANTPCNALPRHNVATLNGNGKPVPTESRQVHKQGQGVRRARGNGYDTASPLALVYVLRLVLHTSVSESSLVYPIGYSKEGPKRKCCSSHFRSGLL